MNTYEYSLYQQQKRYEQFFGRHFPNYEQARNAWLNHLRTLKPEQLTESQKSLIK